PADSSSVPHASTIRATAVSTHMRPPACTPAISRSAPSAINARPSRTAPASSAGSLSAPAMRQHHRVRLRALSVFERIVYHCACIDPRDPAHPVLEVDAVLREGDADGPLLVAVADFKRMLGFDAANACVAPLRHAGRTEVRDGVEYVTFAMWEVVE